MKVKILLTIGLVFVLFLGEIAVSFSFKNDNKDSIPASEVVPLSYKVADLQFNDSNTVQFDSLINDFLLRNKISGASVAVTRKGRLVYAKGYGYAQLEDSIPVYPQHLFRVASVSKLVTAITIMKLLEEQKLRIDDKVFGSEGILHEFSNTDTIDNRLEEITVRHLLNHTAGWSPRMGDPVFNSLYVARKLKIDPPAKADDIIRYALGNKLADKPGNKYHYSNLGYVILGRIIEKITGMNYEEYVQFAILHPLGIYDMHIGNSFEPDLYLNEVRYYHYSGIPDVWAYNGSKQLVPLVYGGNNMALLGAAGGWVASAPELAKLLVAIDGFDSSPDILSRHSLQVMTTPQGPKRRLIGWRGTDGRGTWWRTGTIAGSAALIMRHPNETNWVLMVNTSTKKDSHIHNDISKTMFNALRTVDAWPETDLFLPEKELSREVLALEE